MSVTTFFQPCFGNFDLIQSFLIDSMQFALKKGVYSKVEINARDISSKLDENLVCATL